MNGSDLVCLTNTSWTNGDTSHNFSYLGNWTGHDHCLSPVSKTYCLIFRTGVKSSLTQVDEPADATYSAEVLKTSQPMQLVRQCISVQLNGKRSMYIKDLYKTRDIHCTVMVKNGWSRDGQMRDQHIYDLEDEETCTILRFTFSQNAADATR